MNSVRRICVFCGSSPGGEPAFLAEAAQLGRELSRRGIGLVFGGARVGLMGAVAAEVSSNGGEVIGVLPRQLAVPGIRFEGAAQMHLVDSMSERKFLMAQMSDAFVVLPGGLGTMDEIFEVATSGQLSMHGKPFGILNGSGYYDDLFRFLDRVTSFGFMRPKDRARWIEESDAGRLLSQIESHHYGSICGTGRDGNPPRNS
ncbi:TIGR00730 family Rossman fold protein [Streptomyces sp. NBC_01077]|uniref:LOG family protein n=1 Tax=Streptomyces sp. NBC_01077 TaxID=2903746 RepID=UPI0038655B8F|nr:TIGR00730 family Rossman fold protein [Streptomyces sp. NBC_01077]WSV43615.1 TIGR00730 family Rossman fold protein [Streptomyces sp. NBC_01077]